MEGFTKVVLILTVFLGALSMDVNGGRILKGNDDQVDHPETFGSLGGAFPSPFLGVGGSFPTPSFGGGSLPNPVLGGGSFPTPSLGGGSFPSPSFGFGPSTFCSFPGVHCAQAKPNSLAGSKGGASVSVSSSP